VSAPKSSKSLGKWIAKQLARYKTHPRKDQITCAILFCAGFTEDWILSYDTILTAGGYWHLAGGISFITVVMQFAVFRSIFDDKMVADWSKIGALGLGCACGAAVAVAFSPW